MKKIQFYQTNTRVKSQPFSEDIFAVSLSQIITGCVKNPEKYLKFLHKTFKHIEFADNISKSKVSDGSVDYLVDVGFACHVLYSLLPQSNDNQEDEIYRALQLIDESIAPRVGEDIERLLWE